jgi:thiol:disulfide interchange protein DsbD
LSAALCLVALLTVAPAGRADRPGIRASETRINVQDLTATVVMPQAQAAPGQRIPVAIDFDVAPGWHVYGAPLPEDYTPTTVKFDPEIVAKQTFDFPKPQPVNFKALGQTLPVYTGSFKANGAIWLKPDLSPGNHKLPGTISFQECNNLECKPPQKARFEIPITVAR